MRLYVALAVLLLLAGTHGAAYYAGGRSEVASHQTKMNEAVAALQQAMATQRTASRKALKQAQQEAAAARREARGRLNKRMATDEALRACAAATVPANSIWLQ